MGSNFWNLQVSGVRRFDWRIQVYSIDFWMALGRSVNLIWILRKLTAFEGHLLKILTCWVSVYLKKWVTHLILVLGSFSCGQIVSIEHVAHTTFILILGVIENWGVLQRTPGTNSIFRAFDSGHEGICVLLKNMFLLVLLVESFFKNRLFLFDNHRFSRSPLKRRVVSTRNSRFWGITTT